MTVVLCPRCHEQVTLPIGTPPDTRVRCPLCREEYALQVAVQQLPPCLEIVEHVPASRVPAGHDDAEADIAWEAPFALPQPSDELAPESAAPGFQPPVPRFELESPAPRAPRSPSARPRSRRKPSSPLRAIIQIVGGGVLGLLIAQLVLWWMPGNWHASNRDPFELAQHVATYLPFLVPEALRPDGGAADGGTDTPSPFAFENIGSAAPEVADPNASMPAGSLEPIEPQTPSSEAVTAAEDRATPVLSSAAPPANSGEPAGPTESRPPAWDTPVVDVPAIPSPLTTRIPDGENTPSRPPTVEEPPPAQGETETLPSSTWMAAATEASARLEAWHAAQDAPRDVKRQAIIALYHALARLGAAAAGPGATAGSAEPPELAAALQQIAQEPLTPTYLAQFAARWIDDPARPHSGIAVFGTITAVQRRGNRIASQLQLATQDQRPLVVLSDEPLAASPVEGRQILVLGHLTADGSAIDLGLAIPVRP